jgi:hypothetical protein
MKSRNKGVLVERGLFQVNNSPIKKILLTLTLITFITLASLITFNEQGLAAVEGCYTFPGGSSELFCQDNVLKDDAEADCDLYNDCDNIDDYFYTGQLCSSETFDEICEEVLCTVDCDYHPIASCEYLGGEEIPDEEYDLWCSEGCCNVGSFCNFVNLKYDCIESALQQGYTENDMMYIIDNIDPNSCQTDVCGIEINYSSLSGYVFDNESKALSNIIVELSNTISTTTDANGYYSFTDITPGSYVIDVSYEGYATQSNSISLSFDEAEEINFTLGLMESTATLSGYTVDELGNYVSNVVVCYSGPSSNCINSDESSLYTLNDLYIGDYTFSLSKFGYSTTEIAYSVIEGDQIYDLTIQEITFEGVNGNTWIDNNDDGDSDDTGEGTVYGAKLYVDGVYKGSSNYPDGDYEVNLPAGTYNISATYQDYGSEEYEITTMSGTTVNYDILMNKYIGECSYGQESDQKSVEWLTATGATGKLKVDLTWEKPCPEVSGYQLYKDGVYILTLSPLAISFTDYDVEWGITYSYEIWAVYTDGPMEDDGSPQTRLSSSPATASITLGDLTCEDFEEGQYFCLPNNDVTEDDERKYIYTCDTNNDLILTSDCTSLDGEGSDWYCTEPSPGYAICKNAGNCNVLQQLADPFGLYYDKETCYGTYDTQSGYENYCYYDYTTSVSDKCYSCTEFSSCFDYQSQSACEVNNCFGVGCSWLPATANSTGEINEEDEELLDYSTIYPVTEESGHGYCTADDYEEDDYCSLCSPNSDLFENFYCTPNLCVNLGRCFSAEDLTECNECDDEPSSEANCYEYFSELECIGDQVIENNFGEISLSDDRCSWGRCSWVASESNLTESNGYCVKDGDGDKIEDCTEFSAGEYVSCKIDNLAPLTNLDSTSFAIISTAYPNLTFSAVDEANPLGELYYCLSSSDASDCTEFESVDYPGLLTEESVTIYATNSTFLASKIIPGETYQLRFYSKDKYHNQESVQETYVYIDNELPDFTIENDFSTEADLTNLITYLSDMNEPMACDFTITPILPEGTSETVTFTRDEDKEYEFTELNALIYNVSVTCTDDHANANTKEETLVFDHEQDITLIYPEYDSPVAETDISFQIETAVSASCELYIYDNVTTSYEYAADFMSSDADNKQHETEEIPGFYEGEYAGTVKVVCIESLTDDYLEDYFYFEVDFTAPATQIVLTEGEREELPTEYGWEEYFIEEVNIDFECTADGFDCNATYYCLGEGCEYNTAPGYEYYSSTVIITETIQICYYSEDGGGSKAYPLCGTAIIEGFGINLVNPDAYYYEEELWGISNTATFNWEIMSKLDTSSCRFDLNPDFDFDQVPLLRTFDERGTDNYYVIESFPENILSVYETDGSIKTLYVKCQDYQEEIGPSQKMNLEFDPTAPTILSSYADPDLVMEGIETFLYSTTDDKTLCRFSDDSESSGSKEFDTMEYAFPGYDESTLYTDHESSFSFSFEGAQKNYTINLQCMNGAGDFSELAMVTFSVDYSASGYIVSTSPSSYVWEPNVTLGVETNKNAYCYYDSIDFENTGGITHSQDVGNLEEGDHHYLVSCLIGENWRDGEIDFTIDLTAPTVTEVDDGTSSCDLSEISVFVYTDEENVSSYYYELYQGDPDGASPTLNILGVNGGDNESGENVLISNGTLPADNETKITGLSLTENKSYFVQVLAGDEAGNWGEFTSSDGFNALSPNDTICFSDETAPTVTVTTNDTCSETSAELYCEDDVSACQTFKYGKASSSADCSPDDNYYGNKITFTSSGWLCYFVEDANGNNYSNAKKVTFSDTDGDTIANTCDSCSGTDAGKAVDSEGCSFGQVPDEEQSNDKDSDGLPDYWEKLFDRYGCDLNYISADSDSNGVLDGEEDYDSDSYTNYEEYRSGYDPCVADAPSSSDTTEPDVNVTYDPGDSEIDPSEDSSGSKLIALVFLILGILLTFGGIGFLIYFYFYDPQGKSLWSSGKGLNSPQQGRAMYQRVGPMSETSQNKQATKLGFLNNLRGKILDLKRTRKKKVKNLQRHKLFSEFSSQSKEIPHFNDILSSNKSDHEKMGDMVQRYQDNRKTIKKGLRPEEKNLFSKLDQISKDAKHNDIKEVVNKSDAQDIFKKLKSLSDKRKSGG